jgi:hypothetical protein
MDGERAKSVASWAQLHDTDELSHGFQLTYEAKASTTVGSTAVPTLHWNFLTRSLTTPGEGEVFESEF